MTLLKRIATLLVLCFLVAIPTPARTAVADTGLPAAAPALADVVDQVRPSVVSILVIKREPSVLPNEPSRVIISSGSGFAIRADGFILSNAHVLDHALAAEIHTHDGKVYPVRPDQIWADPVSDIAVAKVDATFRPTSWARANSGRLGQEVFAMGAPYGLRFQGSVSRGIISGFERKLGADYAFIQHDAPINPGNSGGPLFNLKGEVVGVNARGILSGDGMGFAIPADVASRIADALIKDGKVDRAWLGLGLVDGFEADLGWPMSAGPVVTHVEPNGPAAASGIQLGDTLLKLDGQPVSDLEGVARFLLASAPGAPATITYSRGGVEHSVTITLGKRPHDASLYYPDSGLWVGLTDAQTERARLFGHRWAFLELADLTDAWVTYQGGGKAKLVTEYLAVAELSWQKARAGSTLKPEEALAEAKLRKGILEVHVDLPASFSVSAEPWAEWRDAGGSVRAVSVTAAPSSPIGYKRFVVRFVTTHLEASGAAVLVFHLDDQTDRRFVFDLDRIH